MTGATNTTGGAPNQAWEQLSRLSPALREHLRVHVHRYRGEPWYVVEDRISNRFHRFDANAWALVRRLDATRSIGDAVEQLAAAGTPVQPGDAVALLARLHAADLLATGLPPSSEALLERFRKASSARLQRGLMSPLSVRVPLFDPDRLLTRTLALVRALYSVPGFVAWLLLVCAGALLAAGHVDALALHFETRALDPRNVALMWALYPLVKAVHELGHGYAVKRFGGTVHEMGVVLLVFTPVPYVDASASTAFADKRQRMLVAGAGIMVELALAAAAMLAWLELSPGLARDAAFNVMLIGAGSTLLFNGNPLLRYDGYYVLADALETPNLGPRATRYLHYLAQRWLLGLRDAPSPVTGRGERAWLAAYGIASGIYRTVVLFAIALYIAGKMFFIGVALALWVLAAQLVWPTLRLVDFLARAPRLRGRRARAVSVFAGAIALTLGTLLLLPVGASTSADGVVQAPHGSEVRAGADGVLVRLLVADGQSVAAGDALAVLEDPLLPAEVRRLEWRLREVERRHARASLEERVKGQILADEREQARADLADARERLERLVVRAARPGTVSLAGAQDMPGRFVHRGELLAHVTGTRPAVAHVVVPQEAAARVRGATREVGVRLASLPGATLAARIVREVPAASDTLPSRALGTGGGGSIAVDARDGDGLRALERVFQFELALPGSALAYRPGSRVHVRFEHPPEPLGVQWARQVRQLFIARFQV